MNKRKEQHNGEKLKKTKRLQKKLIILLLLLSPCNIKLEQHNVPVLHDVSLTLLPVLSCFLEFRHARDSPMKSLEIVEAARGMFGKKKHHFNEQ